MKQLLILPVIFIVSMTGYGMTDANRQKTASNPLVISEQLKPIKIENNFYCIEVNPKNGAITRIQDKTGNLELIQEPTLADNFEFTLPLPGKESWMATEGNYIYGREQHLTSFEKKGHTLTLNWKGPLKNYLGKSYDVSVTMKIQLIDSYIQFDLKIKNSTNYEIGEVYYPIIGGTRGLGDSNEQKNTEIILPSKSGLLSKKIYYRFEDMHWLGSFYPEQTYEYPDDISMPWTELYNASLDRGVYFAAHDVVPRFKILHLELLPGSATLKREGSNWPRPEELNGLASGVRIDYVHIVYHPPGKTFETAPVILQFHKGGWKEAAKIYRDWFTSQFDIKKPQKNWMHQQSAFQECSDIPFKELTQWAKDGLEYGVTAILLRNWETETQVNKIPKFEPNLKLGTREELAQAINQCHKLGVKVFLLVNIQNVKVDLCTDLYQNKELNNYYCMDRWGIIRTLGRKVWLNPASPGMQKYLASQIKDLAGLGVDGVHLQNFFNWSLDFNPHIDTTPDQAEWRGGLQCINGILKACRSVNPDFCVSIDGVRDHLLQYTDVFGNEMSEPSAFKTAFPFWQATMLVSKGNQYNVVNDALRYGAQLRIAPENRGSMRQESMQELSAYIKEILQIRRQLKDTLICGQYLGAEQIHLEGKLPFSTFRDIKTGQRACAITNNTPNSAQVNITGFEGRDTGTIVIYQPFEQPQQAALPATITLLPGKVAVAAELFEK